MFISSHGFAAVAAAFGAGRLGVIPGADDPLMLAGAFVCGVAPDLPVAALIAAGGFDGSRHRHHTWITHTPIFWIVVSLALGALVGPRLGALLALGTLLHLGTDWIGGGDGIPFLWPLTGRQFGVGLHGRHEVKPLITYFTNGPKGLVESTVHLLGLAAFALSVLGG